MRELAAEMMAAGAGMPDSVKVLDLFRGEYGYATPKVEVRGAVINEDRILLVREREDGGWTVPGGWADVGETPSEMVVREVKEESGFDVVPRKLAALHGGVIEESRAKSQKKSGSRGEDWKPGPCYAKALRLQSDGDRSEIGFR